MSRPLQGVGARFEQFEEVADADQGDESRWRPVLGRDDREVFVGVGVCSLLGGNEFAEDGRVDECRR